MAEIGFVATGSMGGPIARRLLAAGHALCAYDSREEALRSVVALVDAPVSGGSFAAEQGTLTLMASGDRAAFFATLRAIEAEAGVELPALEA